MFPQFRKINNESGVVLFIVLMTSIIIMIFSVSILTQSLNEMNYAQVQIDQISSEEMARGVFWNWYSSNTAVSNSMTMCATQNESGGSGSGEIGRNYVMNMVVNSTVNGVTSYNIIVNYDTFN